MRTPQDLDRLKVRVVGSPIFMETFRALGANPVNMNWGDAQRAFLKGTVDGQENPVGVRHRAVQALDRAQAHHPLAVRDRPAHPRGLEDHLGRPHSADREIVKKTAVEVMAGQKQGARAGLDGSTEAVDMLKKNGMQVVTLSKDEVAAFRARTKPVYDKWVGKVGADLVKSTESIVAGTK